MPSIFSDWGQANSDLFGGGAIDLIVKVGPKGYIHGWIYVGPPGVGASVRHPKYGKGVVHRSDGGTAHVRFDSGKKKAFATAKETAGPEHFEKRSGAPKKTTSSAGGGQGAENEAAGGPALSRTRKPATAPKPVRASAGRVDPPNGAVASDASRSAPGSSHLPPGSRPSKLPGVTSEEFAAQVDAAVASRLITANYRQAESASTRDSLRTRLAEIKTELANPNLPPDRRRDLTVEADAKRRRLKETEQWANVDTSRERAEADVGTLLPGVDPEKFAARMAAERAERQARGTEHKPVRTQVEARLSAAIAGHENDPHVAYFAERVRDAADMLDNVETDEARVAAADYAQRMQDELSRALHRAKAPERKPADEAEARVNALLPQFPISTDSSPELASAADAVRSAARDMDRHRNKDPAAFEEARSRGAAATQRLHETVNAAVRAQGDTKAPTGGTAAGDKKLTQLTDRLSSARAAVQSGDHAAAINHLMAAAAMAPDKKTQAQINAMRKELQGKITGRKSPQRRSS